MTGGLPLPLSIVLPIPRYDIAEADEPLLDELVARGHRVHVIVTHDLEARYHFAARGCRVSFADWTASSHFLGRAAAAFIDTVRLYRLAARTIRPECRVIVHSNDADFIKPFVETAQHRRAHVVFVQMAYFHADVAGHYAGNRARSWDRLSAARRAFLHARAQVIRLLTGVHVYVGPRRVWGTNADICFMADEMQARNHIAAALPESRFRATGVPFMDMIWRRRARFDAAERARARHDIGVDAERPLLLVVTQNPEWLLPGQGIDPRAFARDLMRTTADALPEWQVVFKIHPVETIEDYEAAREDAGRPVHVVREWNIVTALLASDLMLSVDVSSPCYYARALDVPQLIFRVAGSAVNDAHLPNFSDVPMVSDHDGLRAMLRTLATQRSASRRRTASTFDGLASRRIVDELERESAVH